jgi:hypothetical protein
MIFLNVQVFIPVNIKHCHQLNGIAFQINIVREFIQTECMKWPDLDVHSWPPNEVFKNRMQSDGYNCIH